MKPKPTTTSNGSDQEYARFGRAALIPGIQKAIEELESLLFGIQTQLEAAEGTQKIKTVRDVVAGAKRASGYKNSYWQKLTPEERSAEMKRRYRKSVKKHGGNNHPRNLDHPGHQAWVDKIARIKAANKRARAKELAA